MDGDFNSPVNVERAPPPLTFSPDSHPHDPALPSSPPLPTMPLPPLDSTNQQQHNFSQQQLSQPPIQPQTVQQTEEPSAQATNTSTTAPDRPDAPEAMDAPAPQTDGAPATEAPTVVDAPANDTMDTAPDNNTAPTQSNDTHDVPSQPPQQQSTSEPQSNSTSNPPAEETTANPDAPAPAAADQPPPESDGLPPPPPEQAAWTQDPAEATNADVDEDDESMSETTDDQAGDKPPEEHAYWADIEEDTSEPSESELKEMAENAERDYSALEYDYWEKSFFRDVDDPEYQPSEKARVTWKFKGVRGTKENPNRANIMRSPAAYIGGYYWTIKFFPRGNSVSALSVYVECSRNPPPPVSQGLEVEFKVLKGAPDAVLSDLPPDVHIIPTMKEKSDPAPTDASQPESENKDQPKGDEPTADEATSSPSSPTAEPAQPAETKVEGSDNEGNWRVSAQIGVTVYNPNEPRTAWMQSSSHQFNPHNLDWGWTNFHGPWDQIHKRQRCQRQALLRNDTLAFDAYIRIFDDPTKSLWWHSSDSEPVWNSYAITGYAPIGDPDLNYRNEVAALISWCHLAPFREIIEKVDVLANITNSNTRPRPLAFELKKLVSWLRTERYVNGEVAPEHVIRQLQTLHELSGNVVDFWERLRRSLEIELVGTDAAKQLSKIFDSQKPESADTGVNYLPSDFNSIIRVSAKNAGSVQSVVSRYLQKKPGKWSLPEFLTVDLERQEFDKNAGRWVANFERVTLNEELALQENVVDAQEGKYSLYGFVVHNGKRTSGKYYSILRPDGPGGRWLAFQDGRPNKVECLTTKSALEGHCGLDPDKAKDSTETANYDVATVVMYVRNDVVKNYLGVELNNFDLPRHHSCAFSYNFTMQPEDDNSKGNIPIEIYSSPEISALDSLFDGYDLMAYARANGTVRSLSVPSGTTYNDIRRKLALWESSDEKEYKVDRIRLWCICRSPEHGWLCEENLVAIRDIFAPINTIFAGDVVRLWVDLVPESQVDLFVIPDREVSSAVFERPVEEEAPPQEPEPEPVEGTVAEGQVVNGQPVSGNTETAAPERPETPRASDNEARPAVDGDVPMEDGDGDETVPPDNMTTDPAGEGEAPAPQPAVEPEPDPEPEAPSQAPEAQQSNDDIAMEDAIDNDAAIAAVIASDLEELENSQAMDAEPTPPPEIPSIPSQDPLPVPDEPVVEPDRAEPGNTAEDGVMDQSGDVPPEFREEEPARAETAENRPETAVVTEPVEPPKPELPVEHTYYFLQVFDAEKQELRYAGRHFVVLSVSLKEALTAALGWAEDKEFNVWKRVQSELRWVDQSRGICRATSGNDGVCFVVGEKMSKAESAKLEELGSFSTPQSLLKYLWATRRSHPTDAFTGTTTIDDSITGDHYTGALVKGHFHGKGIHTSDAGIVYTGDFVLGRRQGQGLMEYPSGDTYQGGWVDDLRSGQGTFIERRTGNKYVGGYREGKRYGKGISYWEVADEEMDLCQICYSEDQDALFYDCGHVCACVTCAKQVDICPMCRKNVISVVRIYKT